MVESNTLLAGVDIGSTMVRVVLAEAGGSQLDVIGVGSAPSLGVRHGVVVEASRERVVPRVVGGHGLFRERRRTRDEGGGRYMYLFF